jgi:hypothetical protein
MPVCKQRLLIALGGRFRRAMERMWPSITSAISASIHVLAQNGSETNERTQAADDLVGALHALSASTLLTTLPPNRIDTFLRDDRNHRDTRNRVSPPPT